MRERDITEHVLTLIQRTASDLPLDVEQALQRALAKERSGSPAEAALTGILEDCALSRRNGTPLCQDTGALHFYVEYPHGWSTARLTEQIEQAVAVATTRAALRPNAVNSITGANSGSNLGLGSPHIEYTEWARDGLRIRLLLKGGGSENVSSQFSLPDASIGAERGREGVRRVLLHLLHGAQGLGCPPGILGVCIGGDRAAGFGEATRQLLRRLDDRNSHPELAALETSLVEEANALGIGPMGYGGRSTVLAIKIGYLHRLPASFFVSVAYMCWACRRCEMTLREGEGARYA
jgi:fumarate hydratase class I